MTQQSAPGPRVSHAEGCDIRTTLDGRDCTCGALVSSQRNAPTEGEKGAYLAGVDHGVKVAHRARWLREFMDDRFATKPALISEGCSLMDFAKPIHPADVAEYLADQLDQRARHLRRHAAVLRAQADELEDASGAHRHDADLWRKSHPTDEVSEPSEGAS